MTYEDHDEIKTLESADGVNHREQRRSSIGRTIPSNISELCSGI
jgi:hypothetical protein